MKKYLIKKIVEANSIEEALKLDKKKEADYICLDEEGDDDDIKETIGF